MLHPTTYHPLAVCSGKRRERLVYGRDIHC